MKKALMLFFFSCFVLVVKAQINLLYNGSFEQHTNCPDNFDHIRYANYWDALDTNYIWGDSVFSTLEDQYAEYINICGTGPASAPLNGSFYHYPRTGNGMIQSAIFNDYAYAFTGLDYFNYVQGRLAAHLIAGKSYCVTFFVVKEQGSQYSIDKIGAYLDDGMIDTTHKPAALQSQYTPQIVDTAIIYDTLNWTKIQGSFVANGTEKFITIGMFFDTGHVRHIDNYYSTSHYGAYLIDDVSVIASDAKAYAGRDTLIMPGDSVKLGPAVNGDGMPCYWYKQGVTAPIDSGGNTWVKPTTTTSYVVKMELCETVTYDTVKVRVWPDTTTNVLIMHPDGYREADVLMYPSPVSGLLHVDGARGCTVSVYDIVGREVIGTVAVTEKEVLDMEKLVTGVYIVVVTDAVTGYRVVREVMKE